MTSSKCSARCACDVPSHNYTYSFEPKHDWTSVYASSAEIRTYFEDFALNHGLQKFLKLSHRVENTQWSEVDGKWEIEVNDLATGRVVHDDCHILIHACGYLNKPAWPKIPGLDDYQGIKLHSADYDDTISLEGKNVILIGNGSAGGLLTSSTREANSCSSSAAQILPAIQPLVKHVRMFIRSPLWLLPDISTDQGRFTEEEIETFVKDHSTTMKLRKSNETTMNSIFSKYTMKCKIQTKGGLLTMSRCLPSRLCIASTSQNVAPIRDEEDSAR